MEADEDTWQPPSYEDSFRINPSARDDHKYEERQQLRFDCKKLVRQLQHCRILKLRITTKCN